MPCKFLDENKDCINNGPCPEWLSWEQNHSDSESWEFCQFRLSTPLTEEQIAEIMHIVNTGLVGALWAFDLIENDPAEKKIIQHISRGRKAIDILKDRMKTIGAQLVDIETIRKNIEFAIENYNVPENREAVYNALHRIRAEVNKQ